MMIDEYRNGFHIRSIRPIDKEPFMELRRSVSIIGEAYNEVPEFLDWDWIRFLEGTDGHYMAVFDHDDSCFVAACSFQNIIDGETGEEPSFIEIGLDVVAELRGQGIGTCLMHELYSLTEILSINEYKNTTGRVRYLAASRHAAGAGSLTKSASNFVNEYN